MEPRSVDGVEIGNAYVVVRVGGPGKCPDTIPELMIGDRLLFEWGCISGTEATLGIYADAPDHGGDVIGSISIFDFTEAFSLPFLHWQAKHARYLIAKDEDADALIAGVPMEDVYLI